MDSFENPVGKKDPYQNKIEGGVQEGGIQKDKLSKDDPWKAHEPPDKRPYIVAFVITAINKFLSLFEKKEDHGLTSAEIKEVNETLVKFKDALVILQNEDRSQDAAFLNELSKLWYRLFEDALKFKKASRPAAIFKTLIKEIQNYPNDQEHSLGYYFTEFAGKSWLPFPYMEMIQKIHTDHQKNPPLSPLTTWTQQVDQLIGVLNPEV